MFTVNQVKSPSVVFTQDMLKLGKARGVVANSGCANCCVGDQGYKDAQETTNLVGKKLGTQPGELLMCSTGLIGAELPMALIRAGVPRIAMSADNGRAFARAIMTTDQFPKEIAVEVALGSGAIRIGGCVKGVGMIHPNMATMLAFLTTDAAVEAGFLKSALKTVVDETFNMVSVDGDTSTNDTVLLFANGAAGNQPLRDGSGDAALFLSGLRYVCTHLGKEIVRDGEGASKILEVTVRGASSLEDARKAARSISSSLLVKAAVHGNDPNWGRIMMALGKSGARVEEKKVGVYLNEVCVMENGLPIPFFREAVVETMKKPLVNVTVELNLGNSAATAWGCDLSEEYVHFNSAYST
jgi:glutamate N-acetyltransferase/amino-acid N-acetyltransferase